ncbi:ankyrin repeat domain-containing protein [Luteibacter sp. CQ10]|uniref:ankyrin repeat domain-containing protein n=1 Tax=Luteibacter sp. CQ10 TaxID=2805821 RepID=UPI0034A1761B
MKGTLQCGSGGQPSHGGGSPLFDAALPVSQAGSDPTGELAALFSLSEERPDSVRDLLRRGAQPTTCMASEPDLPVLHVAAQNGWVDSTIALLEAGGDPDTLDGSGRAVLSITRSADVMKALLDFGADVHFRGDMALLMACHHADAACFETLLSYGASLDAHPYGAPFIPPVRSFVAGQPFLDLVARHDKAHLEARLRLPDASSIQHRL